MNVMLLLLLRIAIQVIGQDKFIANDLWKGGLLAVESQIEEGNSPSVDARLATKFFPSLYQ
jgi:hypothetical protein